MTEENPKEGPGWLQQIDHTADAGIIVYADSMRDLFIRAAWGMFSIITDMNGILAKNEVKVFVEAPDRQALMVRWLSELNFRHITQYELYREFDIVDLREDRLVAEARGEKIDLHRHRVYTEIKAITFHGLLIESEHERWKAQIIFDL